MLDILNEIEKTRPNLSRMCVRAISYLIEQVLQFQAVFLYDLELVNEENRCQITSHEEENFNFVGELHLDSR